jgi:hypothetical protein
MAMTQRRSAENPGPPPCNFHAIAGNGSCRSTIWNSLNGATARMGAQVLMRFLEEVYRQMQRAKTTPKIQETAIKSRKKLRSQIIVVKFIFNKN